MRLITAALLATTLLAGMPAHAATRTERYVAGPVGDVDGPCRQDNPAGLNVGSVCFTGLSGFTRVSITVNDDVALWKVGFWAGFVSTSGTAGGRWYCAPMPSTPIPSGTARIVVYIGGARAPLEACPDDVGVGTNGAVTAVLT